MKYIYISGNVTIERVGEKLIYVNGSKRVEMLGGDIVSKGFPDMRTLLTTLNFIEKVDYCKMLGSNFK